MDARLLWSRILASLGGAAMLLGAIDPLEGAPIILAGSGLVVLGFVLGRRERPQIVYSVVVFVLIAVGVAAMFVLSMGGGIGGTTGRSMWWGILILPYPVGWFMAVGGAIYLMIHFMRSRKRTKHS